MPTYDYVCRACEHRFEYFQSMQDALLRKCPECGKLKLERLIGAGAGILFKGSGFYETDYKQKSGVPKSEGGGSGKSSAQPEGKGGESDGSSNSGKPSNSGERGNSGDSGRSGKPDKSGKSDGKNESQSPAKTETQGDSKPGSKGSGEGPGKPRGKDRKQS